MFAWRILYPTGLSACVLLILSACTYDGTGSLERVQASLEQMRAERLSTDPRTKVASDSQDDRRAGHPPRIQRVADYGDDRNDGPVDTSDGPTPDRPGPLPGFRETVKRDLKAAPGVLWDDVKSVYASPVPLAILGLTYGGALTLQETGVDRSIEDKLERENIFNDDVNEALGFVGNPFTHLGVAGAWYLVGQQRQDQKTYDVGKKLFSALIINDLSTMGLKVATSRNSPNGESFSFPSGHASSTFTVASVMHEAYGPWAGIPLYGVGVLVAVERLDDDEHYLSDVVMGSVMGLVIGHAVGGDKELEIAGGRIVPFTEPYIGSTGIAWHKRF